MPDYFDPSPIPPKASLEVSHTDEGESLVVMKQHDLYSDYSEGYENNPYTVLDKEKRDRRHR